VDAGDDGRLGCGCRAPWWSSSRVPPRPRLTKPKKVPRSLCLAASRRRESALGIGSCGRVRGGAGEDEREEVAACWAEGGVWEVDDFATSDPSACGACRVHHSILPSQMTDRATSNGLPTRPYAMPAIPPKATIRVA
jgi:hypothetical protein